MRINNNMLAINTHRQLGGVALMQAKSMEKLSSGYRINRAGDDAAGLAISEKMRAQIRGLHTAAKNAQDGISLIQTAEGSLQEVHAMLNRMVELATQSANGTFDDAVDRKNLEAEVTALKGEIDRVAKSANFNGIKLLDGALGSKMRSEVPNVTVHGLTDAVSVVEQAIPGGASGAKVTFNVIDAVPGANQTGQISLKYLDESGNEHRIDFKYSGAAAATSTVTIFVDGEQRGEALANQDLENVKKLSALFKEKVGDIAEFKELFDISTTDAGKISVQTKDINSKAEAVELLDGKIDTANAAYLKLDSIEIEAKIEGASQAPRVEVNTKKMTGISVADLKKDALDKGIIIVDGEKFAFVKDTDLKNDAVLNALREAGVDEENIVGVVNPAKGQITDKEVAAMIGKVNAVFGEGAADYLKKGMPSTATTTVGADVKTTLVFNAKNVDKGKGLTLQVGESSEDFQKINVKINNMSSKGLGIKNISVASQEEAAKSIKNIRAAIDAVSSTRGDLGALQNRLEHTIANINTTAENITASESRIRDVDMAKEMVELTKANILQQAAQAMLAQANQAPQGVLQLLR